MSVDAATLAELRRLEATMSPEAESGLAALETLPAVYGYVISRARADGDDEADMCELLARHSNAPPAEVRSIAAVLRKLGYRRAADRLHLIAGRRKHSLAPLL
jgi:hypothetical protein